MRVGRGREGGERVESGIDSGERGKGGEGREGERVERG